MENHGDHLPHDLKGQENAESEAVLEIVEVDVKTENDESSEAVDEYDVGELLAKCRYPRTLVQVTQPEVDYLKQFGLVRRKISFYFCRSPFSSCWDVWDF